jgi:hypothetical protein
MMARASSCGGTPIASRRSFASWAAQPLALFGSLKTGCKTLIGQRLKQSGMFWGVSGAQNVLDIRLLMENRKFSLFWEQYRRPLAKAA